MNGFNNKWGVTNGGFVERLNNPRIKTMKCEIQLEVNKQGLQIPMIIYAFFLTSMIIDIGGSFGLKYAAFVFLLIYLASTSLTKGFRIPFSFLIVEGSLFTLAPVFFLILAVLVFYVEPNAAISEVSAFAIWLLYPLLLLIKPKERLISFFTNAIFFGSLLIIIIFIVIFTLHYLGQDGLITEIDIFASKYGLGFFGIKPFEGPISIFFPNVYPRWTLLLIPGAILLMHSDIKKFLVVVLATLLTTSTAAILFLLIGLIWTSLIGLWKGKLSKFFIKKLALMLLLFLLCISVTYLFDLGHIIEFIGSKLVGSSSTSIKVGHIKSILALISKDMITLFLGMGIGSNFWSSGVNQMVSNVEVSHFNLIRQFGLPYALAFTSYVLLIFIKLYSIKDEIGRLLSIGLVVLFFAAGTNPVLISPIFLFILVISRSYLSVYAREKKAYIRSSQISHGGMRK